MQARSSPLVSGFFYDDDQNAPFFWIRVQHGLGAADSQCCNNRVSDAFRWQPAAESTAQNMASVSEEGAPAMQSRPAMSRYSAPDCPGCNASGRQVCKDCAGSGRLKRGGYNRNNTVDMGRIINSKWTAMQRTLGWRHFRVIERKKEGKLTFIQLQASCDPNTRLWVCFNFGLLVYDNVFAFEPVR